MYIYDDCNKKNNMHKTIYAQVLSNCKPCRNLCNCCNSLSIVKINKNEGKYKLFTLIEIKNNCLSWAGNFK